MGFKSVTAPTIVSDVEGVLSQYGVQADISEIGMGVMIGLVAFGLARSVLSAG